MSAPSAKGGWSVPAAVALGGAVGAVLRWLVGAVVPDSLNGLPWATLAVNVVGALLLGWLVARRPGPLVGAGFGTGALGAFTTYSAFAVETVELGADRPGLALLYVAATLGAGLAAARAGLIIGTRQWDRSHP